MQLTPDQIHALEHGHAVPVFIDQTECVVIRRDVYEQSQEAFRPAETYSAIEAVLDQEKDPGLDSYQRYKA